MEKVRILFDTDMGADCDDAAALALALELMDAGECELLAVTHCTMCESAAGCIEAILKDYGHPEIPIGSFHPGDGLETREWRDVYATEVAMAYDTRFRRGGHYEDSVRLMRRVLAEVDAPVTVVSTGPLTTLARLLQSQADEFSPLNGTELVREKVNAAYCMAAAFEQQWPESRGHVEWNILCDVPSMRLVSQQWPTEMIFCSFEIGLPLITCKKLQTEGRADHPVRTCFEVWHRQDGKIGRSSWDPATMLCAIRPDAGYWKLSERGTVIVDERGVTELVLDELGKHRFMIENQPVKAVEEVMEEILNRAFL